MFPNVQAIVAQVSAVTIVLGSYLTWQYLRVSRPRRRGQRPARVAERQPHAPIGARELRPGES